MEAGKPLPKINPLTGKPFEVQLDDAKLETELDELSFEVLRKAGTSERRSDCSMFWQWCHKKGIC